MKKLIFGIALLLAVLPCFGQKFNVVQGAVSYEQLLERKNPNSKLLLLRADLNSNNYDCILYVVTDPDLIPKAQAAVAKFKGKASYNDLRSSFYNGVKAVAIGTEPNWRPGKGIAAFNLSEIGNIFYVYAACPKGFQGMQIASHKNVIYSGTLDTKQFTEDTLITFVDKSGALDIQVSNTLKPTWNAAGMYGITKQKNAKGFITIPDSYFPKRDWREYVNEQYAKQNPQQQEQSVVKYKRESSRTVLSFSYYAFNDGCLVDSNRYLPDHLESNIGYKSGSRERSGEIKYNHRKDSTVLSNIELYNRYVNLPNAYPTLDRESIFSKSEVGDKYYIYYTQNKLGTHWAVSPDGGDIADSYEWTVCVVYEITVVED